MRIIVLLLLLNFILPFNTTFGQIGNSLISNEITIDLQPPYPQPGENFTASLNDYSGGAFGSTITWIVDGEKIDDAANLRSLDLTAPLTGTRKVQIVLNTPSGTQKVVTKIIRPVYLDVIIEPQTHVPRFYKGRALPSIGSTVNATALVSDGNGFRNTDLIYTWRLNHKTLGGGAIRGHNRISFTAPMDNDAILTLQVSEPNGTVIAQRSFLLPIIEPEIKFYSVNPLLGISNKTVENDAVVTGNTISLQAEPYHLDLRVYNNPDFTKWTVNGREVDNNDANPYFITLQRNNFGQSSQIGFEVRDLTQVLQGAKSNTYIKF